MSWKLEELEQENFDVDDFIDRVTWNATTNAGIGATSNKNQGALHGTNANSSSGNVDLTQLTGLFDSALRQLETHRADVEKRLLEQSDTQRSEEHKLEEKLQRVKTECWHKVNFSFQQLGKRVSSVSSSVTQLTEQIEALNGPISRLADARGIVEHFARFSNDTPADLNELTGNTKKLSAYADTLLKLHAVVQDLPNEPDFEILKRRVHERCGMIEQLLVEEFRKAYKAENLQLMRALAVSLASFKAYSQTDKSIETFVSERTSSLQLADGIFERAVTLCKQTEPVIRAVFSAPESVMQTLIDRIYTTSLTVYVTTKLKPLKPNSDRRADSNSLARNEAAAVNLNASGNFNSVNDQQMENYLQTLKVIYSDALQAENALQNLQTLRGSTERALVNRLTRRLFYDAYLATYLRDEIEFIDRRFASLSAAFYDQIGHAKRGAAGATGFLETVGSIFTKPSQQSVSMSVSVGSHASAQKSSTLTRGNQNTGKSANQVDDLGNGIRNDYSILLSDELCANMIHLVKQAVQRCRVLSTSSDFGDNLKSIFERFIQALLIDHTCYAIDYTVQCVLKVDEPQLSCLDLVLSANGIVCHFESLFESDCVVPLNANASDKLHAAFVTKRTALERIEMRIGDLLERFLQQVTLQVRNLLKEQRAIDFRPENDGSGATTPTCARVRDCILRYVHRIIATLDGKNLCIMAHELGTRVHRCVLDHFYSFQFNTAGGVSAICDCSEYRDALRPLKVHAPGVDHLFETLHALLQLLVVPAENVAVTVQNEQLVAIDKSIIVAIIERRVDHKKVKLPVGFR